MTPRFPLFIENIDFAVLNFIQSFLTSPVTDAVMKFITHLGDDGIIWIIFAVVLLFPKKTRRCGITVGVALILGLVLGNVVIKNIFCRMRPYTLEGAAVTMPLIGEQSEFSFPSGHTRSSFEAAFVLFWSDKRLGIPALVLATLIAFSRLYFYVHFPTDIIGGIFLGLFNAWLATFIVEKVEKKLELKNKKAA